MTAADNARDHLTAVVWEVLGRYTATPRVHHADMILTAAESYAHALAEQVTDEAVGPLRLRLAADEAFPRRRLA